MPKLSVFNMMSLDGFVADQHGDLDWAHRQDAEWNAFAGSNASGNGTLLFGRITYEMMVKFWPTPEASETNAEVATGMNRKEKIVFSRTLTTSPWAGTRVVNGDPVAEVRRLKREEGPDLVILGSASIVSQLSEANLIDGYQVAIVPIVLGGGKSMFAALTHRLELRRTECRPFGNGNVVMRYERA